MAEVQDGGTIEVWGDGTANRSYTYVSDMVAGIYQLMQSDIEKPAYTGAPQHVSVNELVVTVAEVSGKEIKTKHIDGPVGAQSWNFSEARIHSIGWRAKVSFKEGISLTYPWVEAQVEAARALRSEK